MELSLKEKIEKSIGYLQNFECKFLLTEISSSWQLYKNVESNIEQVLATTPHETLTIRPLASHHENYTGYTSQTRRTLLEKQGRARKWCTPMDPHIWSSKSRTTDPNVHTAAMWGHRMRLRRPAGGDEW